MMRLVPVDRWHIRPDLDLAVGVLAESDVEGLALATTRSMNADVVTIEHSGSINPDPDRPGTSNVTPLLRKGHVIQGRRGLHPDYPTVEMIELSFPALKGASGAPVFIESTLGVVGVVVANLERELLPAQVLKAVKDDGSVIEEIRYFLPNALAVAALHVSEIIAEAAEALA